MEDFGHEVQLIDPYYGRGYTGGRVQAVAVDTNTTIITGNNDRRKAGGVAGYWYRDMITSQRKVRYI